MAHRNGGCCAVLSSIMATLLACGTIVAAASSASADSLPTRRVSTIGASDPWAAHIAEAAKRFAIPERWIRAVMVVESVNDPAALSRKSAIGLMQIMPATWDELTAQHSLGGDPWEPSANILAGAAYLRAMHDRYGAVDAMLAAYNAGPGRYDEHLAGGRALPDETVDYVAKIVPMIDGTTSGAPAIGGPSRPSWSRAPLFVARSAVMGDGVPDASGLPSRRSAGAPAIVDVTALVPPSDGLFMRRPEVEGQRR